MLEKYNAMLKEVHGKNITVQIKSYIEDDGSEWFYIHQESMEIVILIKLLKKHIKKQTYILKA